MIEVIVIETPSLGNRSYLASDGRLAIAVDPPRDIDRVLAVAEHLDLRITHVLETHVHNDYLTGGLALARRTRAAYCLNAADRVQFERRPLTDAELIETGEMAVRVIATPGHTFTHLSYELIDPATEATAGIFTGGSLLCGSTGRTDLLGPEHARALACAQHASARILASSLPPSTPVYPTHGFGSFCAAAPASGDSTTIGAERRSNPALVLDREPFVTELLAGLDAYPAYYAHMAPANAAGPAEADLTGPRRAGAEEIGDCLAAGEWVVDLRGRREFAAAHVPGTFSVELSDSFATYLGWLIPWGMPLTLLADAPHKLARAQRQLARIGIEVKAAAVGSAERLVGELPLGKYEVADFAGLAAARRHGEVAVVDVRRRTEWEAGHLDGAIHLPLHEVPERAWSLPDLPLWVHCQAGYRASIAASLLHATGHVVTAIDDDFARAAQAGLSVRP
jgi:glyoxylase-like metal-dependent hydrolase (beta-lactamase superfamily II)/rhodanese-related sulfurtransferase